jgi:hypothetical protein
MIKSFLLGLNEGFKFAPKLFFAPILVLFRAWTSLAPKPPGHSFVAYAQMQNAKRVSAEIWNEFFGPRLMHRFPPKKPRSVVIFWSIVRGIGFVLMVIGAGFLVWNERMTVIVVVESAITVVKQSISTFISEHPELNG